MDRCVAISDMLVVLIIRTQSIFLHRFLFELIQTKPITACKMRSTPDVNQLVPLVQFNAALHHVAFNAAQLYTRFKCIRK